VQDAISPSLLLLVSGAHGVGRNCAGAGGAAGDYRGSQSKGAAPPCSALQGGPGVGKTTVDMMVPDKSRQHNVMVEAVQNHTPDVRPLALLHPDCLCCLSCCAVDGRPQQLVPACPFEEGCPPSAGGDCGRDRVLQGG
jgi:hypothetical protein